MPLPIADTAQTLAPFHVMHLLAKAKALEAQGRDIIHLEIGEPDMSSPSYVQEAVMQTLTAGQTHYTPSLGLPELRAKLSEFYQNFYHAKVPAQRILLTPGSSTGLHMVLTALLNLGDEVLMCDPAYPCNRQFVQLLHGQVKTVPVFEDTRYQLTYDLLQQHWTEAVKVVMVATPANPTGTLIEQDELLKMAQFLAEKQCVLIVDEIYQGLVYERPAESILHFPNLPDNVIVLNSFSKYFGMTGWRLGWVVAPEYLMPTLDKLAQNLYLAAPTPAQYGALRLLEADGLAELEQRRRLFQQRRDTLFNAMNAAGFHLTDKPEGAFYLYWDVSPWTDDAEAFCLELLEETGVALTPGRDFGEHQALQRVRLAYTTDDDRLKAAVSRIKNFIDARA